MPLFPEINTYYKGRTHTSLVISEGAAPAEKFIPSANESVKFQYAFGPEGNQNVVIPKGKIVALAGMEWDYESEHMVPALKVADTNDVPIGVNHHNVYERRRDRFSGNGPTVITREYIELPLFTEKEAAAAIKFGAAWHTNPADMLGKFVKSDEYGNFMVSTQYDAKVIGQVLAVETDVPPAGFLQYFLEMDDNEYKEFLRQQSYAPAPGKAPNQAGTLSIEGYPLGTAYLQQPNRLRDWNKGLPMLTDGYFRARTHLTDITLDNKETDVTGSGTDQDPYVYEAGDPYVEGTDPQYGAILSVKVTGNVTIDEEDGTVAVGSDARGAAMFIRLRDKLVNDALKEGSVNDYPEFAGQNPANVVVKIGGVQVSPANLHIDYTNNMIVVYFTKQVAAGRLQIDATVLRNQTPGIPTGWDFKACAGAVRILLQR